MSPFAGLRILVVEDEPIVAMCLEDILMDLGAEPIGPASRLSEGLYLARTATIDGAVLDINLGGERSYAIADSLAARGVPFVFASGYGAVEAGYQNSAPLIEKPYRADEVAAALRRVLPAR